jgi:hypothetical protein
MALRRVSAWQIVWAPGAGAHTLLAYGDLMERDVVSYESGAHGVGLLDGALAALLCARGGARRTLDISRVVEHASFAAAWKAQARALAADPWGLTSTLQITAAGLSARVVRAALLSSSHHISTDAGAIETIHTYQFRVSRNT